ncbi:hypothetical protein ACFW1F_17165 [Streptomyces bungoensis]|uniref:hypothetical protein n=1 Tax=Streptomyces bungoensis TaxID=285568 RepID=UPI003686ABAC
MHGSPAAHADSRADLLHRRRFPVVGYVLTVQAKRVMVALRTLVGALVSVLVCRTVYFL